MKATPDEPRQWTDEQWRTRLTPSQYRVLRGKGTEAPFSGEQIRPDADGIFHCAACGNSLFPKEAVFESGCGWPSFDTVAQADSVELVEDRSHGMARTEVLCAECGSHLGHLFPDGPTPTGLRYCINAICLGQGTGN